MKKEEIITTIVIILIIVSDFFLNNYTKKCISKTTEDLKALKEITLTQIKNDNDSEDEKLTEQSKDVYEDWKNMNKKLTFYLEHDELEKVNISMERMIANYEAQKKEDAIPEIEEGIYILRHIKEKQELSLKNIF